jgi:hypothetical protein
MRLLVSGTHGSLFSLCVATLFASDRLSEGGFE